MVEDDAEAADLEDGEGVPPERSNLSDTEVLVGYKSSAINRHLTSFLLGTLDSHSPLKILRGHTDILRIIWHVVCEEWWDSHIGWYEPKRFRYRGMNMGITGYPLPKEQIRPKDYIPDLSQIDILAQQREWNQPTEPDTVFSGCPMAILAKGLSFPACSSLSPNSYEGQVDDRLNINMMPFDLNNPVGTLPSWCHGYLPLIIQCKERMKELPVIRWQGYEEDPPTESIVAYLTIDERIVSAGESHRRGGLHVESPLWFPTQTRVGTREIVPSTMYWGGGALRASTIHGGIFVCSNVSESTAVWNCQVLDYHGEVIRKHGNVEHCRSLLGAPSKVLDAGELIWLTDRTPHESLVLKEGSTRQFFRLVTGEVSAWFTAHNTPNPFFPLQDETVRIIEGNKYELCKHMTTRWECGDSQECVDRVKEFRKLRNLLCVFELGHLAESLKFQGISSIAEFMECGKEINLWANLPYNTFGDMHIECDKDMINYMISELTTKTNIQLYKDLL